MKKQKSPKKVPKQKREKIDKHLGCPAWPNCDEAPMGCYYATGGKPEMYGHRE